MDDPSSGKASQDRSSAALDALRRTRADLVEELQKQVLSGNGPSPAILIRLARLDEATSALKALAPNRKRAVDLIALGAATLLLLALSLVRLLRISAIVDAHFRLIVDGETVSPWRRWGSAQELV